MSLPIEKYLSAARVAKSLLDTRADSSVFKTARDNAKSELHPPINTEMEILPDMLNLLLTRKVNFDPAPYWLSETRYDPLDVLISTVGFYNHHGEPLPQTTTVPENDVAAYITKVIYSREKLTLADQLQSLLDISKDNILGAANIGFLSTRLLARGWDTRAYPNIEITPEIVYEANRHLAPFESHITTFGDPLGDTYYFWTHFFATSVFYKLNCQHSRVLNNVFAFGTPMMVFVRKYLAGQPTLSQHYEASELGRHVGIAVSKFSSQLQSRQFSLYSPQAN